MPALQKLMTLPQLEVGNCSWGNSVAAIYTLLILESLQGNAVLEQRKKQKVLFDKWHSFVIDASVEKYINNHAKLPRVIAELYKSYYPFDPKFIA